VLYEEWIDPGVVFRNHQRNDGLAVFTKHAQEVATIIAHIQKVPADIKVLDFGMGWGQWALMAKGFGCDAYGTELSEARIRFAKSNGVKIVGLNELSGHSFDFINTDQVFEHLPNPLETLVHLRAALHKDGLLKICVPTANDISRRIALMDWTAPKGTKNSLNAVAPLEHINYFRRESLLRMASLADMQEVSIPLMTQYRFSFNWDGPRKIVENALRPLYLRVLKRKNYILLRKAS
jgi:2-polyprenyl-3-methyl-5-hydroxy-6-metoxy-1,4-benzoquinol methylase